ncbi:MAG TPA: ABC transporter ATP-binding protein [Cytophagales bacterium]|nr:ABC transporter ATP-binding protein [Cytophagales bacterium]
MRNPYFSLLGTAWKYARQERRRYVMIYAMFIIANVIFAMNPLLYGWFVDSLQREGTQVLPYAWMYVGGFLGLRLLEWCFHGPARVMERQLAFNLSRNFQEELYNQVLHLPVKWHQDHHSGSTINRVRKAYESLKDFFQNGFIYLHAFGKFVFSFAAMLYFSPLFGSIGVLIGAFTVFIIIKFDKPYIKSLKEYNEKDNIVSSNLFDSLSNIVTVITLRLEKSMESSFMKKVMDSFPPFKRNAVVNEWKWFCAQMLVGLIYAVITIGYVYQHWVPGETFFIGGLIILIGYVNQFTSVFNDIASQYTQIVKYDTNIQMARDIQEDYHRKHRSENTSSLPEVWRTIEIKNLNFSREAVGLEKTRFTGLSDLSIKIEKGQRIALIGESGSGKSTLLALLRGLYQPKEEIDMKVDGVKKSDFESITNTVTLFPQEPEIFENSILYNITLGLPFSNEEVMEVCETAQFADVLMQLPNGLETHIQEKGVNLSGGQKQRLALARGILAARTSNIVLFDEPTSSVDPKTEALIYNKLFNAFNDKAVISSLHRLHLLTQFDYVYILKNGSIVDQGTFEELRRRSLVFNEMWKHQEEGMSISSEEKMALLRWVAE